MVILSILGCVLISDEDFWARRTGTSGTVTRVDVGSTTACSWDVADNNWLDCWGARSALPDDLDDTEPFGVGDEVVCGMADETSNVLRCWGDDDGVLQETAVPNGVMISVDVGSTAACALDDSGVVTCLSYADGGEDIASEVPAVEDENDEFETISVGRTHACGIRRSRVPVCWGESSQYEAMGFSASIDCTEVFAGNNATYADCDGYGWFEGGEEGVSIELGADLLAAPLSYGWVCVADDGSVQCSGSIPVAGESSTLEYELSDERLEMPPPAGDVVSISAGETAFCAVLVDDTTEKHAVVCNEFNNEWSALTDPP